MTRNITDKVDKYIHSDKVKSKTIGEVAEVLQEIIVTEVKEKLIEQLDGIYADYCNGKGCFTDILANRINSIKL